jgi:hypothetical protein
MLSKPNIYALSTRNDALHINVFSISVDVDVFPMITCKGLSVNSSLASEYTSIQKSVVNVHI